MPLEGKIDMVTGSGRGIGFEFAKGFAEKNCAIFIAVLAVKNEYQGQQQEDKWQNIASKIDSTNGKGIQEFTQQTLSNYKQTYNLANNSCYPFDKNIW